MQYLLVLVLGLLYLGYLACAVPVAAICAFAVYGLGLPVTYFVSLGRVLVVRPPSLSAPKRRAKIPANADPAVLQYFYGPAVTDADHSVRVAYHGCRRLWQQGTTAVSSSFKSDQVLLTAPLGVGGAIGMAAGTAFGTVVTAACAMVHLLAVGISAASVRTAGTTLRIADSAVLRVKNIRMVCPNCYERVPYPAYECPGPDCTRRHRDVRPGRFGIIRRRCQCGAQMKTLLLFGSSRMKAHCPHCHYSLEHRPGSAPEIVLPFFGATGAGKTRLLFSMVAQLQMWSEKPGTNLANGKQASGKQADNKRPGGEASGKQADGKRPGGEASGKQADDKRPGEEAGGKRADGKHPGGERRKEERFVAEFADSATTRKLNSASKLLRPESATDKTPVELPQAYIIRLISKRGSRILHLFDAAGELFYTAERTQELRYLNKAETFILVIDPLSVEAFWDRLPPDQQTELKAVRSAATSPELAYQQAHQEIEAMGVQLRKARLAVVFSRADLIDAPGGDVATWARDELGLGNLVRSARLNFKQACFFHTAAVMTNGVIDESVPALMRWLLARSGVNLPGDAS